MAEPTNTLADFPPDRFRILCACSECYRTNRLDRSIAPESMGIKELRERATCKACGSRNCGIRIVYAGSGGCPSFFHSPYDWLAFWASSQPTDSPQ